MQAKPNKPKRPTAKRYFHSAMSPMAKLIIEAIHPPRCQDPSIMISALPLTLGGKN
jgi:hypothetical protein